MRARARSEAFCFWSFGRITALRAYGVWGGLGCRVLGWGPESAVHRERE